MQNKVELIHITPNYMDLLKYAIGMCHQTKVGDKVVKHCIKAGHLSVLEHCTATFEISCSIQMLLQLTRHRHLNFTVQSSRVTPLPESYKTGNEMVDYINSKTIDNYNNYCEFSEIPQEVKAYLLPKSAMYNLVVTGNFRAWFEYLPKRMCARAQTEHREVANEIKRLLAENAPEIFKDVTAPCSNCNETSCDFSTKQVTI